MSGSDLAFVSCPWEPEDAAPVLKQHQPTTEEQRTCASRESSGTWDSPSRHSRSWRPSDTPSNTSLSSTRWRAEHVPAQGDRFYEHPGLHIPRQREFL